MAVRMSDLSLKGYRKRKQYVSCMLQDHGQIRPVSIKVWLDAWHVCLFVDLVGFKMFNVNILILD